MYVCVACVYRWCASRFVLIAINAFTKMERKNTWKSCLLWQVLWAGIALIAHAGNDVHYRSYSPIVSQSLKLHSCCGNQCGKSQERWESICLKIQLYHSLPYTPMTLHSTINSYSTMFIATIFKIARNWKQLRCPSKETWIKKMWYGLHNGVLLNQ